VGNGHLALPTAASAGAAKQRLSHEHGPKAAATGGRRTVRITESSPTIVRSTIGCFACALLILACVIDHGGGKFDFLDWPGVTAALILIIGLPHGALDIEIMVCATDDQADFSLMRALLSYISIALSVILLWWLLPIGGLIFLLLLSAYHFGGDWPGFETTFERVIIGASVLSATALVHENSVLHIFSWLVPIDAALVVAAVMHFISIPLLLIVVVLIGFRWRNARAQCEEIIVTSCAAVMLPPITFFVIYFCSLHSMRHLMETRQTLSGHSLGVIVARGAPYAFIALFCCWAGAVFFPHLPTGVAFLSSVFVGLAALTVPHMLLCEMPRCGSAANVSSGE
jgi:beta-carotene 15,15'-dioxygenase